MALTKEQMLASIERAKTIVAAAAAAKAAKLAKEEEDRLGRLNLQKLEVLPQSAPIIAPSLQGWQWNAEQQLAIDSGNFGKSFCLIGAAGTGKTTTLKAVLTSMLENHRIPPLEKGTKHLTTGAPGVALISYTRRAVRNIARQMPEHLKGHCITFHKLVEYEPFYYDEFNEESGELEKKMRFQPARHEGNTLPANLKVIVIDEASMLSVDYFNELWRALPNPYAVQFIVLGDLNQLPPVYGQAILGKKLLELPIIELTRVYRQALESPIIALALAVKNNNFREFQTNCNDGTFLVDGEALTDAPADILKRPQLEGAGGIAKKVVLSRPGRGKVTLHPWKKELDLDDALHAMQGQLSLWLKDGTYNPDEDLVLCPWNKSFGTDELNLGIADMLAKRDGKVVHEIIAGFNKYYWAEGDKLLVDKQEAIIVAIHRNPRYLGKAPQAPSTTLNRWGNGGSGSSNPFDDDLTDEQIDFALAHAADVTDRTTEASHQVTVIFQDTGEEAVLSKSATINSSSFAYAITVHKAQGSECRRVFFLTHAKHAAMCSRELVYTAITRAAEELYIVMPPKLLVKAASKPRIKGDTLAAKLEFFASRMEEKAE